MVGTRSVLLAVGDRSRRETYADWLSDEYKVVGAGSRLEARRKLSRAIDVVVVSDDLVGGELSPDAIRRKADDCRLIAVTSESTTDASHDEFDDALSTPMMRAELEATVDRYLAWAALDRALRSFYSLAATKAELETEFGSDELTDSSGYDRICQQIVDLQSELDDVTTDIDSDWPELFEDSRRRTDDELQQVP